MTLDQLKMFVLVAEHGSLKKASTLLYKTQPAISQGIKQLEHKLGLNLFSREGYRLVLTDDGKKIYHHANKLLNEAADIQQVSQYLAQGNEAIVTVAIEASYDLKRILPVLETTQKEFPQTQIILKQEYISGAHEALQSGQADLAISPFNSLTLETGQFDSNWLYEGFLINIASPKLLARHPSLSSVSELQDEYQIVVQDSGLMSKGVNYSVQTGQRCWYVNDFSTKKMLILNGMGWGSLPEHLIEHELKKGDLCRLNLNDTNNSIALNYHGLKLKTYRPGPVAQRLWESIC